MVPRLVPEILELDAFCDGGAAAAGAAGIGDSRSWIHDYHLTFTIYHYPHNVGWNDSLLPA